MVMKHKYGEAKMQRFLRYELDRYLIGRGTEQKKELPLARVENQDYIHYRKGSLVMYALQDYIGEDKVNQALRAFRDATCVQGPALPQLDANWSQNLRKVTPAELQYVIDDMFETITLYDNRAVSAKAHALPGRPLRSGAEGACAKQARRRRPGQGNRRAACTTGSTSACSTPTTSRCLLEKNARSTARRT